MEEGSVAVMGQKFIFQNGTWMPHSKAWCKIEGNEKVINQKRRVASEKKKQKVESVKQQTTEKIKEKNTIKLDSFEL